MKTFCHKERKAYKEHTDVNHTRRDLSDPSALVRTGQKPQDIHSAKRRSDRTEQEQQPMGQQKIESLPVDPCAGARAEHHAEIIHSRSKRRAEEKYPADQYKYKRVNMLYKSRKSSERSSPYISFQNQYHAII